MQKNFLHAFNLIPGVGYMTLQKLWLRFGNWQHAWERAEDCDFLSAGLTKELVEKIYYYMGKINPEREFDKLWQKDIFIIDQNSKEFPVQLKNIPCPPFLLYRKGAKLISEISEAGTNVRTAESIITPANHYIAIVGTRIPSSYGEKIAREIGVEVAVGGGTIVSGLAYGIDAIAHYAAVKNGKPTVAVLASGIDKITPAAHYGLARKILETGGTLISEYTGENVSHKSNFRERNRLISGLSKATIIIEAKVKSGALITAHHALVQGRDIFSLVGDIGRAQAQGCLNILMKGEAQPIFNVDELMQMLGFENRKETISLQLSGEEILILNLIKSGFGEISELINQSRFSMPSLSVVLTKLEIKKLISRNNFNLWEITK